MGLVMIQMNFNTIYTDLIAGHAKLALVGLGYVGI